MTNFTFTQVLHQLFDNIQTSRYNKIPSRYRNLISHVKKTTQAPTNPSLRELITNVQTAARALGVSPNTVYNWIAVDRVPPRRLARLAEFLDKDFNELWHLIAPKDKKLPARAVVRKPRGTIETLLDVLKGTVSVEEAALCLGLSVKSVRMTLERNPATRLIQIKRTLEQVQAGTLSVEEAATRLGVEVPSFHRLRAKFGYSPGRRKASPTLPGRYTKLKVAHRRLVLDVISGRKSAVAAAKDANLDLRTFHRHCKTTLQPRSLNELSRWNKSFRMALAWEIDHNRRGVVEKWRTMAQEQGVTLVKPDVRLPKVKNWKSPELKHLLAEVLSDGLDLVAVAAARGGSDTALRSLFDAQLRTFDTTFDAIMSLSVHHQAAMAEILGTIVKSSQATSHHKEQKGKQDDGTGHKGKSAGV